jgi:predicted helicase
MKYPSAMPTPIQQYLREVERDYTGGKATEHTYRPTFKALVESFGKNTRATNEPKRVACGAPDFIVERSGNQIGFIECKDIGVRLDETEKSEQLQRYFAGLENLILTDYLEFRYYLRGEQKIHVQLARIDGKGKVKLMQGADEQLATLFDCFVVAKPPTIATPKELAARLAKVADIIRDAIEKAFALEGEAGTLHGEYESFRATILGDMTAAQFADMYAQTVCYGMFSARVNMPDDKADTFTREHAAYDLPKTNPFLREVFEYIAGTKLDAGIVWIVDNLAEVLRRCDMRAILKDFGSATRQEDPVVHFYETFLSAYDPALRESRGVYYTPQPVVSFIVRSIDAILKRDFACPAGLADNRKVTAEFSDTSKKSGKVKKEVHRVQILDPATGTGTFLYETIRHVCDALAANRGVWPGEQGYVAQHLLPRLHGFELMMAPYAVAHLKLGWLLKQTGYDFAGSERLRVYLTNTLEEAEVVAGPLLALANQIAREANAAGKVKTECPIMVIMGNPPYSGHSANKGQWIADLLRKKLPLPGGAPGYFECDGQLLGERNPKWLNDDYVKFIRFAQYRIELTGHGVLGFITNHGYLDNPTFRGMRQSLMQTFDEIYVLDLHGNAKKKETSPDGSKDENVFDIMQGVAIALFIRKPGKRAGNARVFHMDTYGTRQHKYDWLNNRDIKSVRWARLKPAAPFYLFVPFAEALAKEYEKAWRMPDAMPVNSVGVVTARDALTIQYSPDDVWRTVTDFIQLPEEVARAKYELGKDARDWQVSMAQADLRVSGPRKAKIYPIMYRPFDIRYTYYTGTSRGFLCMPRPEVMRQMLAGENCAMICTRQTRDKWDVHATRAISGHKACSAYDINTLFPLYLYSNGELIHSSPWPVGKDGRRPNLAPAFVEAFAAKLGLKFIPDGQGNLKKTFGPEDVFHYAYAVFHCPTYRSRYAEFLKIDFPRLPLTGDKALFARLAALGRELVGLHLLEHVPAPQATYPQAGDNLVARMGKSAYKSPTSEAPGRVLVNDLQYFDNVPPEVRGFYVGGYQVCEKWLKDRKGRTLSYDDIEHYRKMTEAVRQTLRLMEEIDHAIPAWPME